MHKLTLLYAEDDQETRENYTYVLKKYFHKVYTAGDGREALDTYHEKKPDILLLDISLPYMDGLDIAKEVRKEDDKTPIIMLTAYSERNTLIRAVNLKLEEYLLKPIDDDLLKDTMLKLIKQIENRDIIHLKEGFSWSKTNFNLLYKEHSVKLTKKERKLMQLLSSEIGKYCTRDTLIFHIWDDEIPDSSHDKKLIQLVSRFNKKIMQEASCSMQFIENSYALGYRLSCNTELIK